MFTAADYRKLSDIVFRLNRDGQPDYPGYRPAILESPNGDENWDTEKRYAHVAVKYLRDWAPDRSGPGNRNEEKDTLNHYLTMAHNRGVEIAIELGVPREFWPTREYSAMRILEYPAGAITHEHVDFDLFTLMCYRNIPRKFQYCSNEDSHLKKANELNQQIHFGEILELVVPSMKATPHRVDSSESRSQYSIVYFTIPDHEAVLPGGITVGAWLEERLSRSRKAA